MTRVKMDCNVDKTRKCEGQVFKSGAEGTQKVLSKLLQLINFSFHKSRFNALNVFTVLIIDQNKISPYCIKYTVSREVTRI